MVRGYNRQQCNHKGPNYHTSPSRGWKTRTQIWIFFHINVYTLTKKRNIPSVLSIMKLVCLLGLGFASVFWKPELCPTADYSTAAQRLQQSSPGRPRKVGECATPRLRRSRQSMEEVHQGNRSPSPSFLPAPPPPPPPLAPFRRPRGRPRSNPLPNQTQGPTATPVHSVTTDSSLGKKRRRCRNRKYQNGEYIVECELARAEPEEKCVTTRQAARAEAGRNP